MKNGVTIQFRWAEFLYLGGLSVFCFLLSLLRVFYTESSVYLFLNWNLFLAAVPWFVSSLLRLNPLLGKYKPSLIGLLFIWLIFFPNAPYIFTDLFHLKQHSGVPLWFDLMLILSFAWTGMLFGILSLRDIERSLQQYILTGNKKHLSPWVSGLMLFIAAYGVYVGRYLRWNSWDVIQNPQEVLIDLFSPLLQPLQHVDAWGVTILIGIFLNLIYWSFNFFSED